MGRAYSMDAVERMMSPGSPNSGLANLPADTCADQFLLGKYDAARTGLLHIGSDPDCGFSLAPEARPIKSL